MRELKSLYRLIGIFLIAALCLSLAACGGESADTPAPQTTAASAPTPTPSPAPAARTAADADAPDKAETVYVQADAAGTVRDVTVETVLNYGGTNGTVEDVSFLTDIKNTEGDEEFTVGENGAILWEDHGETIRYEGKGQDALPITVAITYWLDGMEISPADLAGKSGHVRIRFDYENHTSETVTVTHADLTEEDEDAEPPETEEIETPIPFLAITLVMLPEDVFSNVTVENGRLLSLGEQSAAVGLALPGLSDALSLSDFELTEDVEIPAYVEIEADVTDFSMDFTATLVTNGLLDEMEDDALDAFEKLSDGMDKLTEASEKITDGARELANGAYDFADYLDEYADGVWQLYTGASTISTGMAALSEQTAPLRSGAALVRSHLGDLREAISGQDIPELTGTAAALEAVIAALDTLEAELAALPAYGAAVSGAVSTADAVLAGISLDALYAALDAAELDAEDRAAIAAALGDSIAPVQSAVESARYALGQVPDLASSPELSAYAATIAAAIPTLREKAEEALASADSLPAKPAEAVDQLSALTDGVTALCDAIDALADGTAGLSDGAYALATAGDELAKAADTLADGSDTLADGVAEFDKEGIGELADLAGDELVTVLMQLKALREADLTFDNFGGIAAGRTGSVRFLIETDAVE